MCPLPVTWFPEFGSQAGTLKRLALLCLGMVGMEEQGASVWNPHLLLHTQVRRALRVERAADAP